MSGPAGAPGNGRAASRAARARERWGVHGRGQHERDNQAGPPAAADGGTGPGAAGHGPRRGGRRGEQLMVPRAQPDSYYGKPVLKVPVWRLRDVGGYLFMGGLAGASGVLAGCAQLAGHGRLARTAKVGAAGAIAVSGVALVADLGRPERFLNMLRMIKPSSPMSVGTWVITAFGGAAGAAAASAVTGRLPRAGAVATAGTTVLGPVVCTYTAALLCDTAVPAWHDAHREMPYLFAGSAAAAAGGLGMLAGPAGEAGPAVRFALLGAATEITAKSLLLRRLGDIAEPYQHGRPGRLMELAELLTSAGLAGAVLGGHSRVATRLAGAALLASSALTRLGIFEAGQVSAADPKYTIGPQRERLNRRRAEQQEAGVT